MNIKECGNHAVCLWQCTKKEQTNAMIFIVEKNHDGDQSYGAEIIQTWHRDFWHEWCIWLKAVWIVLKMSVKTYELVSTSSEDSSTCALWPSSLVGVDVRQDSSSCLVCDGAHAPPDGVWFSSWSVCSLRLSHSRYLGGKGVIVTHLCGAFVACHVLDPC